MTTTQAQNATIQRTIALAIAEAATALGGDREAMVALLGQPDDERIPIENLYTLWEVAAMSTNLPSLPIRVGSQARFDKYGALGIALYVSRTNEIALRRLTRYHDMITDSGTWSMRVEGDDDLVVTWTRSARSRWPLASPMPAPFRGRSSVGRARRPAKRAAPRADPKACWHA